MLGNTISRNAGDGILGAAGILVSNNTMLGNTTFAIDVTSGGYRANVMTGNNGGDSNAQVATGSTQIGTNVCGSDTICP